MEWFFMLKNVPQKDRSAWHSVRQGFLNLGGLCRESFSIYGYVNLWRFQPSFLATPPLHVAIWTPLPSEETTICQGRFHIPPAGTRALAEHIRCYFRRTQQRWYFETEKLFQSPGPFRKRFPRERKQLPDLPAA